MTQATALSLLLAEVLPDDFNRLQDLAEQIEILTYYLDPHASNAVQTMVVAHDPSIRGFTLSEHRQVIATYLSDLPGGGITATMTLFDNIPGYLE